MNDTHYDVIIIGSGPGGGSVAYGLADTGARILVLERGDYLPAEPENWDPTAVFGEHRYKSGEFWWDERGQRRFRAGVHYWVGGNTKMYGAALTRARPADFEEFVYADGISPKWPIGYDELSPYHSRAEQLFRVHGALDDPSEPEHSAPYPFPALAHEPYVQKMVDSFSRQKLAPVHLPMGIDLRPGGTCVYCSTCDGFPCKVRAKSDAEMCLVRPALEHGNVQLMTKTKALRLITDTSGRSVRAVECERDGQRLTLSADTFVVSCGAVNSAALLLRSKSAAHPKGLANRSGMIGRNYMMHNNAVVVGIDPRRRNKVTFQKTLHMNDWYLPGQRNDRPLGNAQLIGKVQASMLKGSMPYVPNFVAKWITAHSHEWWMLTEDLPSPDNRIRVGDDDTIHVDYTPNNRSSLYALTANLKKVLKKAGFPIVIIQYPGLEVTSHQGGTLRFGTDPETSVLDPWCRAHDVDNLYAVDASFFPSLPAMGPTLTIVSQGLRVSQRIARAMQLGPQAKSA